MTRFIKASLLPLLLILSNGALGWLINQLPTNKDLQISNATILQWTGGCILVLFILTLVSSDTQQKSAPANQNCLGGLLPLVGGIILFGLLKTNFVPREYNAVVFHTSLFLFALGTVLPPMLLLPRSWLRWLLLFLPAIGLGITVHFARIGQWLEAFVSLLLTVILTLLIVAGKFFIEFINRISQKWDAAGQQLASRLADSIWSELEVWAWELTSPFKRKYYKSLIYACRDYRTQGLKTKGPFTLDLEKVFVPLRVAPESTGQISPAMIQSWVRDSIQSIWDFLAANKGEFAYRSMAIIAPPGSGKTTLLEHLTLIYAQNTQHQQHRQAPQLIPILLYLRDVGSAIAQKQPSLSALIEQLQSISQLNPPPQWFERKLHRSSCLVMLDGLDEVADFSERKSVSHWLNQQIQNYPHARFILTSRPFGYHSAPVQSIKTILEVQPFNLEQMQKFIHNWYLQHEIMSRLGKDDPGVRQLAETKSNDLIERIKNSPPIAAMAVNPLLLTMIATVHCYRGALPGRRVELYAEICDVLLGRRREEKGIVEPLTAEQKKAVLQVLALWLMSQNTREFTPDIGSSLISNELAKVAGSSTDVQAFLVNIETVSGLLVETEQGIYEFAHKSFQEYLAAVHIEKSNQEQLLISNINNSWWDETIRLYAAISNGTNLISAALNNPTVVSLKLALDCQEEGLRIEPEVSQQLSDKLEAALESNDPEIFQLAAEVKLRRRLSNFVLIDENLEIDNSYITCAEYQLFINSVSGKINRIFSPGDANKPITGLDFSDRNWFYEWLRTNFTQRTCYRHANASELQQSSIPEDAQQAGDGIRLVRFKLPFLYNQLYFYLVAGKWKEANQETLKLMLKLAGRQKEDRLDVDAIQNFPCQDLRMIDQLWVAYSNGRFGFSVQKRIWLEVCGQAKRSNTEQAYKTLSYRVGWRKGGIDLRYHQLTFSMSAPLGHLPITWRLLYLSAIVETQTEQSIEAAEWGMGFWLLVIIWFAGSAFGVNLGGWLMIIYILGEYLEKRIKEKKDKWDVDRRRFSEFMQKLVDFNI